jgi:hypothetical protein
VERRRISQPWGGEFKLKKGKSEIKSIKNTSTLNTLGRSVRIVLNDFNVCKQMFWLITYLTNCSLELSPS